jgi:hypothetical protein
MVCDEVTMCSAVQEDERRKVKRRGTGTVAENEVERWREKEFCNCFHMFRISYSTSPVINDNENKMRKDITVDELAVEIGR